MKTVLTEKMKPILNSVSWRFNRLEHEAKSWVIFGPIVVSMIIGIIVACYTGFDTNNGIAYLWCLVRGLFYGGCTYIFLNILFWAPFTLIGWLLDLLDKQDPDRRR